MMPVQISWFVEPVAQTTTIILLFAGLTVLYFGVATKLIQENELLHEKYQWQRIGVVLGFGAGFALSAWSLFVDRSGIYAIFLFALFRSLEGAAVVRLYRKIIYVFKERSLPDGVDLKRKIGYKLAGVFSILIGIWLSLRILFVTPLTGSVVTPLAIVWTAVSFITAFLGATWRLELVRDRLNVIIILGFGLCVAASEIYSFSTLRGDLAQYFIGSAAYSAGFWLGAAVWILDFGSDIVTTGESTTEE